MKVICVAQCFHKGRTYLPGQVVTVSDLNQIPPQHFSTVAGEPLVTRNVSDDSKWLVEPKKNMEWLVNPKTGKPLDGQTTGAEDTVKELTVPEIKKKLDDLAVLYQPSLKRAELLELLEEAQEEAVSE